MFAASALDAFSADVAVHEVAGGCRRPVRGELPLPGSPVKRSARLLVDWSRCDGHGLCAELLPGLVRLDGNGFPEEPAVPVPDSLEADAEMAVRMCPALALRVSAPG